MFTSAFRCVHKAVPSNKCQHRHTWVLLQASIFLQDAQAAATAGARIAQAIRQAVRTSFLSLEHGRMSFPGLWTFILPQSSSFKKLASQLTDLQQIEAAEVSKYLSLLDVLVYAQSSKQASFQSPGLLAGTVNMTQLLQFATPKFVHAFCEASASTMSHSGHATLTELHLPARCFTDSNIKPLEPIQEHLSSLCKLSITSSVFFGPSLRQLKAPFADFVSKLAPHSSLMQLSICLLYTSPSPRDRQKSRMPSSA